MNNLVRVLKLGASKECGVSRDVREKQIALVDPVLVVPVR
jgi:hypothetical protein